MNRKCRLYFHANYYFSFIALYIAYPSNENKSDGRSDILFLQINHLNESLSINKHSNLLIFQKFINFLHEYIEWDVPRRWLKDFYRFIDDNAFFILTINYY